MTLPRHFINVAADQPEGAVPMLPWAAELLQQRLASEGTDLAQAHCRPTGLPELDSGPLPFKIVQASDLILILYEENTVFRQIFMSERQPVEGAEPRYMGYSTGRWEGDELIVDTVGFVGAHQLDEMGHPLSDQLHLIERFRRPDAGHLEMAITVDDPGAYPEPIHYTNKAALQPDDDLLEYFCTDNEKDVQHYQ